MIYHPNSKQIIGLDISNGSQHDIKLARKTVKKFKHCEYIMTDLGYYGLEQDGFKLLGGVSKSMLALNKSVIKVALLHKDLKCKAPLIEPNLRRNLGKWST